MQRPYTLSKPWRACVSVPSERTKGCSLRSPPIARGRRRRCAARGRLDSLPRMVAELASMPSNALLMKSSAPLTGCAAAPTRPCPRPFTNPAGAPHAHLSPKYSKPPPEKGHYHTRSATAKLFVKRDSQMRTLSNIASLWQRLSFRGNATSAVSDNCALMRGTLLKRNRRR